MVSFVASWLRYGPFELWQGNVGECRAVEFGKEGSLGVA